MQSVKLFGVICQSTAGKVCFWDGFQQISLNPPQPLFIASTNSQDLVGSPWLGGAALVTANRGMCTDCHRGENPFIVVPGAATDLRGAGVSQFSGWYEPIVGAGWLQNPGPGTVPSSTSPALVAGDGNCLTCHFAGGGTLGGRFPVLGLMEGNPSGYCTYVLDQARILNKMPPSNPEGLSFAKHWDALSTACNSAGPPTITMPPSTRYALAPALIMVAESVLR
jgi:hypothetical protein